MDKQDITGNGGVSYTLTHAVANVNEIEVFVNNVRQEPSVAYTVAGTALTMTGNVASSDDFYVVFQGKALQTVVPPDGSVTSAKLASGAAASNLGTSVNLATIKDSTGTNTAVTIDSSGNVTQSQKVHFLASKSNGDVGATADIAFNNVTENVGSGYNSSTGVFTAPVAGLYFFSAGVTFTFASGTKSAGFFESDNTAYNIIAYASMGSGNAEAQQVCLTMAKQMAVNDTVKVRVTAGSARGQAHETTFTGYRIG